MLLARDSIVRIFIPSSILLPTSLFTRSLIHHLVTNSLVICLQAYDVYYREGPEIPLWNSEWQILISIYANSTNTFGDTCRASLWSPSYDVTFDSTQGIPLVSGSCMILWSKELILDMKKAIANNLNDHYAKLTDGYCPSHHSPNDAILFIKWQHMSMVRKLNHLWLTS